MQGAVVSLFYGHHQGLTDADFWREVHSKVTIPDSTNLLSLSIERVPPGAAIRGMLWLDNFQLSPDNSPDDSPKNSKDNP
jgi:hypothetical protein